MVSIIGAGGPSTGMEMRRVVKDGEPLQEGSALTVKVA